MSIDTARGTHPAASDRRRYSLLLAAVIVALVLAGVALAVANGTRGPRIEGAQFNPQAAVTSAGSRLVLTADQPLAEVLVGTVTVSPAVPVEVTVKGSDITVTFDDRLDYSTDYTVTARGVTGLYIDASATFDYVFRTPDTTLTTMVRGRDGQPDSIRRTAPAATDPSASGATELYSAEGIEDFVALDGLLVVHTLAADGSSVLTVVPEGGQPGTLHLTPGTRISELRGSPSTSVIGFLATDPGDPGAAPSLYAYDLTVASGLPARALTAEGDPVTTIGWRFLPDSAQIVYGHDGAVGLWDPVSGEAAAPAGSEVDAPDTQATLPDGRVLRVAATAASDRGKVLAGAGGDAEIFYTPAAAESSITSVCLSDNGQYVAIEVLSPDGASTTAVLDSSTGRQVRRVAGGTPSWCSV